MTVLVGLNILVSSFSSGRQFWAIAGSTHCLAACRSLVVITPDSCFRGHIFNFHMRLPACFKYFRGFPKYLQTDAWIHSFIHCIGMCRMRRFLAVLRSFFHSSLLHTFSCHPSPPTILPSSLTSSCHLFLGLPLNFLFPSSYIILFWDLYFLPLSVHAQTNVICLTLLFLL